MDRDVRLTGVDSIAAAVETGRGGALTFLDDALKPTVLDRADLFHRARGTAQALASSGVRRGDRVCVNSPTSPEMLIALFGIWRMGAVPVVIPSAARGSQGDVLSSRVSASGAVAVVGEPGGGPLDVPVISFADLEARAGTGPVPDLPEPDDLGLLQFTSGTTGASKAVPIRQGQLLEHIGGVMSQVGLKPGDTLVHWLPLYHDMGIVSMAGALANGMNVVVMATETFVQSPGSWMTAVSEHRATVTVAPNFAYGLAAKVQELRPRELDLSGLRVALCGAEPVTQDVMEHVLKIFGPAGMRPGSLCPTYGLAEATLAVSVTDPAEPVSFLDPDKVKADGEYDRPTRPLVSCGRPVVGTEIAIRGRDGTDLPPGEVGEVTIKGPDVMAGYWAGEPGVVDGWLPTGDLGLFYDGELYLCGRIKEMIIVGGRNLYPEDYEQVAEQVPGVRSAGVVAFALTDSERMVIVAEGRGAGHRLESLAKEVFERVRAEVDHAPREVVMVKPGSIPKTSSGKRQRGLCRELYLNDGLKVLCSVRA
ncbi:fatty acyl-AMP ligase [Actinomadura sp. KC216]|uniref:AMP-binding protein n=1 Tax=Actinomadura sp. KC216 TaxID=2530370 RepID=UPI001049FAFB|nr:AMP-binding protein [Actinomadura sp. KC216]TDB86226.1 fatty acyl-AMP ligase [Actinomadura sp. KC216]